MRTRILVIAAALIIPFASPAPSAPGEELPVLTVGHVGHDHQIALYAAIDEGRALETGYGVWFEEV